MIEEIFRAAMSGAAVLAAVLAWRGCVGLRRWAAMRAEDRAGGDLALPSDKSVIRWVSEDLQPWVVNVWGMDARRLADRLYEDAVAGKL